MNSPLKAPAPSVSAAWDSYRKMVIPATAPDVQVNECRLAFWAGASVLFYSILKMLDPGTEPTDADLTKMDALHKEVDAFARTFDERITTSPQTH